MFPMFPTTFPSPPKPAGPQHHSKATAQQYGLSPASRGVGWGIGSSFAALLRNQVVGGNVQWPRPSPPATWSLSGGDGWENHRLPGVASYGNAEPQGYCDTGSGDGQHPWDGVGGGSTWVGTTLPAPRFSGLRGQVQGLFIQGLLTWH